jgi:hypothetical protein
MDESRIKDLVEELHRIIPKEGAAISFRQYGGGPDESMIAGNRVGLLRAGVELLRAGVGPASERPQERSLTSLHEITHAESQYRFDYFEEKTLPEDRVQDEKNARVAKGIGIGLAIVVIVLLGLAAYGFARLFF